MRLDEAEKKKKKFFDFLLMRNCCTVGVVCIKHTQKQYKISNSKTTLLFPSTGHKRKGLNFIIEALKQLPEDQFECLIAGNCPKNANLPNNIKYIGYIKNGAQIPVN